MQPKLMFSVFDLMGAFSMIFAEPRPESKEEEDEDENQAPSSSSLVLPPQLIRKIEFNSSTEVKYKSFHDTYIYIYLGGLSLSLSLSLSLLGFINLYCAKRFYGFQALCIHGPLL